MNLPPQPTRRGLCTRQNAAIAEGKEAKAGVKVLGYVLKSQCETSGTKTVELKPLSDGGEDRKPFLALWLFEPVGARGQQYSVWDRMQLFTGLGLKQRISTSKCHRRDGFLRGASSKSAYLKLK